MQDDLERVPKIHVALLILFQEPDDAAVLADLEFQLPALDCGWAHAKQLCHAIYGISLAKHCNGGKTFGEHDFFFTPQQFTEKEFGIVLAERSSNVIELGKQLFQLLGGQLMF